MQPCSKCYLLVSLAERETGCVDGYRVAREHGPAHQLAVPYVHAYSHVIEPRVCTLVVFIVSLTLLVTLQNQAQRQRNRDLPQGTEEEGEEEGEDEGEGEGEGKMWVLSLLLL